MAAGHGPPGVQAPGARASSAAAKVADNKPAKLVDVNSASRKELKTLPGIGDAEADRIIAGRPYLSKTHLVSDARIPAGIYQSIRHRIIAIQNKAARAKLEAAARAGSKFQATAAPSR
jgi:predicted DNA-binding helix-hairpin-helix protein